MSSQYLLTLVSGCRRNARHHATSRGRDGCHHQYAKRRAIRRISQPETRLDSGSGSGSGSKQGYSPRALSRRPVWATLCFAFKTEGVRANPEGTRNLHFTHARSR